MARLSDGESVFWIPGTLGPYPPSARCLASVSPKRRAGMEALVRRDTLALIFLQAFDPDGSAASGAFISEHTRQINWGLNIAGVELTTTAALVGLVPDGVRTVIVRYESHVTFSATVHDNTFVREIPNRFTIGSGDPAEQQTWKDRHGRTMRTIVAKPDEQSSSTAPGTVGRPFLLTDPVTAASPPSPQLPVSTKLFGTTRKTPELPPRIDGRTATLFKLVLQCRSTVTS